MENNQYPTQEYVNEIKNLITDCQNSTNKKLLNYWKHELYILTGEKQITNENYNTWNWMANLLI